MTDIMMQLREKTAPQHHRAEQNRYTVAMLNRTMTLEQYGEYLAKFYGFVRPLEQRLEERPEWRRIGFDISARMKSRLLEADLAGLGWSGQAIINAPDCLALPDVSTFPRALGCLYVLEGSTLGGQMLTKLLIKYLPVSPETNARYLNSYGDAVRARWDEFRGMLTGQAHSGEDEREMLSAAGETFDRLHDWLEQSSGTSSR